jgi:hypothetical protein
LGAARWRRNHPATVGERHGDRRSQAQCLHGQFRAQQRRLQPLPARDPNPFNLIFEGGRFRSTACDRYGYGDGAYVAKPSDDGVAFEAETESAQYGKLRWHGVVRGPRLDGTLTMLRNGQATGEKWVLAGEP